MKHVFAALAVALLASAHAAGVSLPKRDLTVELRQVEEGREGQEGGSRSSAGHAGKPLWEPQMVQVRNGERATLQLNDAMPYVWTQSVSAPNAAPRSGMASPTAAAPGAGLGQALSWFDAGQRMEVQVQWPGGNKPAVLELEVQRAAVQTRSGQELPQQSRNTLRTTITAPLAEWVTIARSGSAPAAGSYSSQAGLQARRLLQVRVLVP